MAQTHQLFSQVRDDPLGTSVQSWGNALHQGCNLSDFQLCPFHNAAGQYSCSQNVPRICFG